MNITPQAVPARSYKPLFLVLALSLALPVMAQAQQGPPFDQMDADGDGFVSETELNAFRAERMTQRASEGRPMGQAGKAPTFATMDTDQDGQLSREELDAVHAQRGGSQGQQQRRPQRATFEEIDLDGDGCISREELDQHHAARGKGVS